MSDEICVHGEIVIEKKPMKKEESTLVFFVCRNPESKMDKKTVTVEFCAKCKDIVIPLK